MASPFVYFAGVRLSQAELSSARLDGDLVELGEGFIPADVVESVTLRAASLTAILGDALAATHESAAWVLGRLDDPPPRHTVQRAVDRRLHHVVSRRVIYRDVLIASDDLLEVGGVRVSTPARTLVDLARSTGPSSRELAATWSREFPAQAQDALEWLAAHRSIPRKRDARMLLSRAQDDVTR
jgi:hypothetical protein